MKEKKNSVSLGILHSKTKESKGREVPLRGVDIFELLLILHTTVSVVYPNVFFMTVILRGHPLKIP